MNSTHLLSKFQEVIWREALHCDDEAYAYQLLALLPDDYENRTPQSVFRNRPKLFELENALYGVHKISGFPLAQGLWTKPLHQLTQSKNNPVSVEKLMAQLNSPHWTERFIARHTIVYVGGEAVPLLIQRWSDQAEEWAEEVEWLLENIALETSKALKGASQLLCPECVVTCGKNKVSLRGNGTLTFYGCQRCYQSRKFIERPAQIVAVLDATIKVEQKQNEPGEGLRVNWLKRKTLFEFDQVEIVEATDEEVELFAVQVGNDTDRKRRNSYKKMSCTVYSDCRLLENTLRILERTFGRIKGHS